MLWSLSEEMDMVIWIQILAICISHSVNTFGKDKNPTILPTAMSK